MAVTSLENCIEQSLKLQTNKFRNRIHFSNDIMTSKMHLKGEQHLRYNLKVCKKKGAFDILNENSENVTLVQLIYTLENFNRAISIVRSWIFDSSYKKYFL